eukprot:Amastigsp_a3486_15.p5 type:complete len:109 gc:universal Amastigsp_a3486_15:448-122(-)
MQRGRRRLRSQRSYRAREPSSHATSRRGTSHDPSRERVTTSGPTDLVCVDEGRSSGAGRGDRLAVFETHACGRASKTLDAQSNRDDPRPGPGPGHAVVTLRMPSRAHQ